MLVVQKYVLIKISGCLASLTVTSLSQHNTPYPHHNFSHPPAVCRQNCRASFRSRAVRTPPCTPSGRGRSVSTPASPRWRRATSSTARTSRPDSRGSASPSIWQRTAGEKRSRGMTEARSFWTFLELEGRGHEFIRTIIDLKSSISFPKYIWVIDTTSRHILVQCFAS